MTIDLPPEPPAIIKPNYSNIRSNKMIGEYPEWIDSPYCYYDENSENGWMLKEDAPEELKQKYKEYMDELD